VPNSSFGPPQPPQPQHHQVLTVEEAHTVPIRTLAAFYRACKAAYYNTDTPLVSDDTFDDIERVFRKRSPTHPALQKTGASVGDGDPLVSGRSVKLPYWMGSQDKLYPEDSAGFRSWRKRVPTNHPCLASVKLDGLSAILVITTDEAKLLSRGDGQMASDWTHHLGHMPQLQQPVRSVQQWLHQHGRSSSAVVLRGEAIMAQPTFIKHRVHRAWTSTARNVVSGLLNAKESDSEALPWVDIVCYEVVEPRALAPTAQLTWLNDHHFRTVSHSLGSCCNASILPAGFGLSDLEPLFWKYRERSPYATDGVVVVVDDAKSIRNNTGNPKHAFAFKIRVDDATQVAETEVVDVEWNIARTGYLKPTVLLREVDIGGVRVQRATGYNYKFIIDNRIGKGAQVKVRRCGDVIPNITAILRSAKHPAHPPLSSFTLTETGVDAVANDPSAFGATNTYAAETLAYFFKVMHVPHISAKTAARFVEQGYTTPFQVAQVSVEEMATWDGFAEKSSRLLYENIRKSLREASALQWVVAGGVFGRGVGERKLKALGQHAPQLFVPTKLKAADRERLASMLLSVEGFQQKTVQQLLSRHMLYLEYWEKVQTCLKQIGGAPPVPLGTMATKTENTHHHSRTHSTTNVLQNEDDQRGKVYCFTGFRDVSLEQELERRGGSVEPSLTSKVNVLVCKDAKATSAKVRKAKEKGVEVVEVVELRKQLLK
jgi:DNA ligase (NAD+)